MNLPSACFSSCTAERAIVGVVECRVMRVPLTQPGLATFFFWERFDELMGYLHYPRRWAHFLYRVWLGALLDRCLVCIFCQDHVFFLPRPVNDRFHAADVQRDPTIPSSVLPASSISSPCSDANEEINL